MFNRKKRASRSTLLGFTQHSHFTWYNMETNCCNVPILSYEECVNRFGLLNAQAMNSGNTITLYIRWTSGFRMVKTLVFTEELKSPQKGWKRHTFVRFRSKSLKHWPILNKDIINFKIKCFTMIVVWKLKCRIKTLFRYLICMVYLVNCLRSGMSYTLD